MAQTKCRVIALAPGRDIVSLQQIAQTLSAQVGVDLEQLLQELQGSGIIVAEGVSEAEAAPVAATVTRAGADFRILDPMGQVLRQGGPPKPQALNATMMGGFGVPGTLAAPPRELSSIDESDLLTLDEAQADVSGPEAHSAPPVQADDFIDLDGGSPAGASGQAGTTGHADPVPAPITGAAPRARDALDGLNADSLMLLDGTVEQKAPPPPSPMQAVVTPSASDASSGDDGAFTPPTPAPSFLPESANAELELDTSYTDQGVTGPSPQATLDEVDAAIAAQKAMPRPPPPPPSAAPVETPPPEPEPRSTARRDWLQPAVPRAGRSARRRAGFLLLDGRLRASAHLRVAIGIVAALLLGSILPMCHAGSVMSSSVHTLRVELSTSQAHRNVRPDLRLRSVDKIEKDISRTKTRKGMVTFLIWLSCSGLFLFLWFRFS